jgi:hypothetical protein
MEAATDADLAVEALPVAPVVDPAVVLDPAVPSVAPLVAPGPQVLLAVPARVKRVVVIDVAEELNVASDPDLDLRVLVVMAVAKGDRVVERKKRES